MKAVHFSEFQQSPRVVDVEAPRAGPKDAVLRVTATGLCRSDWHGWMGHDSDILLPHVPGHELAGVVEDVGRDVRDWTPGDRVTVPFCCGCDACDLCANGQHQICDNYSQPGFTHWGSFAESVLIRYADVNLVRLPDSIDDVTAASLGCRFATSFRGVVDQGRVQDSDAVVIFGCGGVGLSAVMIAASLGARVIAVDLSDGRLERATQVGASDVINADGLSTVDAVLELTKGRGADVTIDAFGSQQTCSDGIRSLRKQGRHVQIGLLAGKEQSPRVPMELAVARELEIVGSHGMSAKAYPRMLQMIEDGTLSPQQLIDRTITLEEAAELLPQMDSFPGSGAIVVDRF